MNYLSRVLCSSAFPVLVSLAGCDDPATTWQKRHPEQVGLESQRLDEFAKTVGGDGVVIRHGYLVEAWGDPTAQDDWASAAKPLLSTLLFFAVHEGKLNGVGDLVRPWARERWPDKDLIRKDRSMAYRQLANMTSGYARAEAPGTHWAYNDLAIALYGQLLSQVFGTSLNEAALTALQPLQFEDGDLFGSRGGAGVVASPRDFARIGWFWLSKGRWQDHRVLPVSYFDRYVKPDVPANLPRTQAGAENYLGVESFGGDSNQEFFGQGVYGFNWWFNGNLGTSGRKAWPHLPDDAFAAIGLHGQVVLVIPSLDIVVAARGDWGGQELTAAEILMDAVRKHLPGQVIVDPGNPRWLKYHGGGPFFMAGVGDPEDFLYRGKRNADGTRDGDQLKLIEKLKDTGANSVYMMAIRRDGDGEPDETPFKNPSDPRSGPNQAILDQWELWFKEMDQNGIVIYFLFYDDDDAGSATLWGEDLDGAAEHQFFRELVERFKHHKHLIWVIKEEYAESMTEARASALARTIKEADDHGHPVAVHHNKGLIFDFPNDPSIDQFAIQYEGTSAEHHDGMVTASRDAAGRYNLNMAEGGRGRRTAWASAMGGAYYMAYKGDIATMPLSELRDYGRLRIFMESTDFHRMAPHDELGFSGTQYVLAQPGQSYIAYAASLEGDIGLKDMSAGVYNFRWFDCKNGKVVEQTGVAVAAGDRAWTRPEGIGRELAVYIRRASDD